MLDVPDVRVKLFDLEGGFLVVRKTLDTRLEGLARPPAKSKGKTEKERQVFDSHNKRRRKTDVMEKAGPSSKPMAPKSMSSFSPFWLRGMSCWKW